MTSKGYDRFGASSSPGRNLNELIALDEGVLAETRFIPVTHPGALFFYYSDDKQSILNLACTCRIKQFDYLDQVREYLDSPGIHSVLYVAKFILVTQFGMTEHYRLRSFTISQGTPEYERSVFQPKPMREWLGTSRIHDDPGMFPHSCPRCCRPAYIGFNQIECSNGNCH